MNSDTIVLSIITPCFNDGRFLLEAVESAESNKSGRHEIIIVDDGSDDPATLKILQAVENRGHRVLRQANQGQGAARNHAIVAAQGRYILPLDSDNRIRPAYLDQGITILDRDPTVDVVYGDVNYFGDKNGRNKVGEFDFRRILVWNYIDACAVFRKSAWERCGGYDERSVLRGYEDWDLWCRIASSGGRFHYVPEVLFDYRVRGDSTSAIAGQPDRRAAMLACMRAKKFEVTSEDYIQAYQSWDPVLEQVRRRPLRTAARLLFKSFLPHWRPRFKSSFHAKNSATARTP